MFILDILRSVGEVIQDDFVSVEIYDNGEGEVRNYDDEFLFHISVYNRDGSYDAAGSWFCRWFGYVEEKK